jgi:hypothetical protein
MVKPVMSTALKPSMVSTAGVTCRNMPSNVSLDQNSFLPMPPSALMMERERL